MKLNKKIIFPKSLGCFTSTIGEIPTSYLKSLTYEEQLMWFCNYFKNVVVPTLESTKDEMKILKEKVEIIENELTKYYTKEEIDAIVNNINSQLENIYTKTEIDNIINGINTQLENIYTKEEIDNIIDDLNEIINDKIDETNIEVEKANMIYNALPKVTDTGTSITLNDTANAPMKMSLGASELEQESTTGKNLLYLPFDNYTSNDITTIINDSGISINGTASKTYGTGSANVVENLPADTYTLSINKILPFNIFLQVFYEDETNENKIISRGQTSITFTTTQKINSIRLNYSGFTINTTYNEKVYMQLEQGSTATDYEPYTGGNPAPNPDYPQPIHTISGDNEIKVGNANIWDEEWEMGNINNDTGALESSTTFIRSKNYIQIKSETTYYRTPSQESTRIFFYDKDKTYLSNITISSTGGTFTTPSNAKYILFKQYATSYNNDIAIIKSTTATSYVPHEEQEYELNLGNLEVCKIGDYEDEFYKATASDTGLQEGKWYLKKNIGKNIITSVANVGTASTGIKYAFIGYVSNAVFNAVIYCLKYINNNDATKNNAIRLSNTSLYVYDNRFTDIETASTLLYGLEYYYQTTVSTYILLNDTLQTQLNNIRDKVLAYQDQTNISQVNNDLPFTISASAIYDLNKLVARVAILETE